MTTFKKGDRVRIKDTTYWPLRSSTGTLTSQPRPDYPFVYVRFDGYVSTKQVSRDWIEIFANGAGAAERAGRGDAKGLV